jgi:hypothetical protein
MAGGRDTREAMGVARRHRDDMAVAQGRGAAVESGCSARRRRRLASGAMSHRARHKRRKEPALRLASREDGWCFHFFSCCTTLRSVWF